MNANDLAHHFDHTLLKPEATSSQIATLCEEASTWQVASVCVSSCRVALASSLLVKAGIPVCTVIGFPSGTANTAAKQREAEVSASDGAREFDMVLNIGLLKDGDHKKVAQDLEMVRSVVPSTFILKVIIESAALTDIEIVDSCKIAMDAGLDFVKTSTGFHPSGGASVEAVRLMRDTVGSDFGVKASGGIRTLADAKTMLEAGASRLGASATVAILNEANS